MTKRRMWRLAPVVLLLAGAAVVIAVVIPGSPVYLPTFFGSQEQYDGHSTRYWIQSLDSTDVDVRCQAIFNLGAIGSSAGDAVPALAAIMLEDPDRTARIEAALALSKMDPASRGAVPQLATALAAREPFVRMNAALALFRLRQEARPAIPALVKAIKDNDPANQTNLGAFVYSIQGMMVMALGRASAGRDDGVATLRLALDGAGTEQMRLTVVRALGMIGTQAGPAVPQLRALLLDNSIELRQAAAEALVLIEGKPAKDKRPAKAADDSLELPETERQYLWEIEHHGNLLVKHGFGPLAAALKSASAAGLTRLLADDFAGTDLTEPKRVRAVAAYAEVERIQDGGRPPRKLDRAAFIARLLEIRKVFAVTPPQVKIKLMTLSPKRRGHLDGRWTGTAKIRLYGEHAPGAPAEAVLLIRYEVPRPTEKALGGPGWLRGAEVLQVQSACSPHYLFAEVARQRGFKTAQLHDNWKSAAFFNGPGGVYVGDFDRDGILDVLITDVSGNALYRGRRDGTFEDVTKRYGLPPKSSGNTVACWIDIDGDGWDDLLLGGRVYRNDGGKRFVDVTDRCNLHLPMNVTSIAVADYDRDGRLDLYVTRNGRPGKKSWLSGRSGESNGNYLFRNRGGWQFEDVTRASGTLAGHRSSFAAAWLDANNDGWPDLHVINEFGDGVLLINNHNGTFAEHRLADHPADFGSMGLAVGDINNDGNIDIYCANMYSKAGTRVIGNLAAGAFPLQVMEKMRRFVAGSQLHLNQGGLKFEQVGQTMQVAAVGWAYGACLADLDNDGWLDIYATCGFVSRDRTEPDG